ncbi:MAG TPA: TrkA family potassium uptake protein [Frankiaceae bacterium]|nr:TrkA family potassium uptake protein [Frankiaceae bacterium]
MHVVIMGCGRVGSTLARTLEEMGHTVAVIDRSAAAFKRLPANFQGRTVTGFGFDQDTLAEAGIAEAGAFAAVSNGDNSNIISARVARENFGVENVVARIYDPRRAEVYERLGIPTVATVRWTADQVLRRLIPSGSQLQWSDPSGEVLLAEIAVNRTWAGHRLSELEGAVDARIACMTRLGSGRLPEKGDVVQEGDLFHFVVVKSRLSEVERIIAGGPEGGSH